MKIKTLAVIATFTVLLCCKNETNIKNKRSTATKIQTKDSSKQEKATVIKNNEYLFINDKKMD